MTAPSADSRSVTTGPTGPALPQSPGDARGLTEGPEGDLAGQPPAGEPASWVSRLALVLGLLADAGLATLLIAISGFVFGGPEGARGETSAVVSWGLSLAVTVLAPAIALWLWRHGRRDIAVAAAWLPPLALMVGITVGLF